MIELEATGRTSRRTLLRALVGSGAVGTAGAFGAPVAQARAAGAPAGAPAARAAASSLTPAAGAPAGADVLVVLTLRGGFDALSAVVPGDDRHYERARPGLAVRSDRLLPLDSRFGLSPPMQPLHRWWREGALAVVQATGQIAPDGRVPSRSHAVARAALDQGLPRTATGWLARALGRPDAEAAWPAAYLGDPTMPGALAGIPRAIGLRTAADLDLAGLTGTARARWLQALAALHANSPVAVGRSAAITLGALKAWPQPSGPAAVAAVPNPDDGYPDSDLGSAMRESARLVQAGLGVRAICVEHDGWDLHADAAGAGTALLADLAGSLDAFASHLGRDLDRVTVVTQTEFGRRVAQNGTGGTDHGAGSAMLLLGGGVRGGAVYGQWPGLEPDVLVGGAVPVVTDYRLVLAEVLQERCAVPSAQVFPGLRRDFLGLVRPRS